MPAIFFIETPSKGIAHGIGAYAQHLIPELAKIGNINLYYTRISFADEGSVKKVIKDGFTLIEIIFGDPRAKNSEEINISHVSARAVFCILSNYFNQDMPPVFHFNSPLQLSLAEVAKEYDCRIIYTQHVSLWRVFYNNDLSMFKERWKINEEEAKKDRLIQSIKVELQLCKLADRIVFLNDDARQFAAEYYNVTSGQSAVIPNGLTKSAIDPRLPIKSELKKQMGFCKDDFIILFVGRLLKQKGVDILLDAFRMFAAGSSGSRLLIVGSGDLENYIARSADICGKVSFTGYVDASIVDRYYAMADIGVIPSATEQSSFVAIEMLSHGLPLVVSDIHAFMDPFAHMDNVLKAQTTTHGAVSAKDLSHCFSTLYQRATLRETLSSNARKLFSTHFTGEIMGARTYALYC